MEVEHIIIHEIKKVARVTGAKVRVSHSCLDNTDPTIIKLVNDLSDRYINKSENYGIFDSENETRFHQEFVEYNNNPTEDKFVEFSKKTTKDLRAIINSIAPAKGGFLIFSKYKNYRNYIGIFLVRDTEGVLFKRDSTIRNFSIKKAQHIDFEKMAMACRINLESFAILESRYLSFINKKSDSMSQYFSSWISSTDNESDETDTNYLYKILKTIDTPLDVEGNVQSKELFLEKIYNHVHSVGRRVNVKEISRMFYDDENKISNYANENDLRITTEFKAHQKILKRFVQIKAKANNIEISFPKDLFNTIIRIPEGNSGQIIIDAPELAAKIREEANG